MRPYLVGLNYNNVIPKNGRSSNDCFETDERSLLCGLILCMRKTPIFMNKNSIGL